MNLRKLDAIAAAANASSQVFSPHGHSHFARRLLGRRNFLEKTGLSVGALMGSGLLGPGARAALRSAALPASNAGRGTTSAVPVPIPGGLQLLGPSGPLFHFFLPASGAEPSTITNFNGFVGWAAVGGTGTHTPTDGASEQLVFESDMRFMRGEFIGEDGRNHRGAFAFI